MHEHRCPANAGHRLIAPARRVASWRWGGILLLAATIFCVGPRTGVAFQDGSLTPAERAAAMQLVREHHPELFHLVRQLREMDPAAHRAALLDLSRVAERLNRLQQRHPERYELELEIWKLDSRIRLRVARSAGSLDETVREEIRGMLRERDALKLQSLEQEQERAAARTVKIGEQLETLRASGESRRNEELERLLNLAQNRPGKKRPGRSTELIPNRHGNPNGTRP